MGFFVLILAQIFALKITHVVFLYPPPPSPNLTPLPPLPKTPPFHKQTPLPHFIKTFLKQHIKFIDVLEDWHISIKHKYMAQKTSVLVNTSIHVGLHVDLFVCVPVFSRFQSKVTCNILGHKFHIFGNYMYICLISFFFIMTINIYILWQSIYIYFI